MTTKFAINSESEVAPALTPDHCSSGSSALAWGGDSPRNAPLGKTTFVNIWTGLASEQCPTPRTVLGKDLL